MTHPPPSLVAYTNIKRKQYLVLEFDVVKEENEKKTATNKESPKMAMHVHFKCPFRIFLQAWAF